jgi:hypothetical protein
VQVLRSRAPERPTGPLASVLGAGDTLELDARGKLIQSEVT